MKAIKHLSVIASVLMLASCTKEEILPEVNEIPSSGRTTVTFVSSTDTKTYLDVDHKTTHWGEDENVLLWEGETSLNISSKSFEDGILTLTADVDNPQSLFYSVIGPKDENYATRTSVKVLEIQHPAQASFDPNAEILVAQPATCSTENTVALRYNRPVAITIATLKNLEAGEKVLTVKITADQNLTGSVNFTYDGTNVKAAMEGEGNTITCKFTANNTVDESGEFPVYFISLNAEVKVFEFEVSTDKHKYYKKVVRPDDSPIVLNDNRVASFGFKLDNADKADAEGDKFVKVTSEPADWSGEYLLVYEDNTTAYCWTGVDAANCNTTATIADGAIASQPEGAVTITIASMEGGYSVLVNGGTNNGKYIYGTSGKNEIKFGTTASANTLSYDSESNSVLMTSNTSVMRYNSVLNDNRFRYYKSGQQPIQLFKKTLGGYGLFTLHTPTNIQYDSENNKITWDAVENAGKYKISLNGGEPMECEINEYSTSELTAEYYYASVIALPSAETEDTYKQSEAGSHEGWFKIGEPKMPKLDANNITLNITKSTITASWENDPSALNGYIAEIWSRTKNDKDEDVDDELLKTEDVTEGTVTFTELTAGTKYHIKVTTKAADIVDERGTRAYVNSDAANKYPQTSSVYTIAEILALSENTVTCQVENAVIYAKGESCYFVNDGTGYIMVNASAGDYAVGDKLTISGKTQLSNSQKRFDNTTTIIEKTGTVTPVYPDVASYDGEFTYAKYVNIVGKMTSSSGWLVTDASGNIMLKVLTNEQTGANKYVSVTGYLTHDTGSYKYLIATEIIEHSLTVSPEELTWEANETGSKSISITSDDDNWTFSSDDNAWNVSKSGNTLNINPVSANTSVDKKEHTITLTHATNTQLTKGIKVTQNGKEATYEKVTNVNDLAAGDKIVLVYETGNKAAGPMDANSYFSSVDATITNGVLTSADAIPITLEKSGDNWMLKTTEGTVGATGTKASLSTSSGTTTWTISIEEGNATIASTNGSYGRFLYNVSSPRFANYTSNTSASMVLPQIFKLQKSITTVVVSGTPSKTEYEVGDSFDPSGLTVIVNYDDNSSNAVSSGIDWDVTPASMTKGLTSVSVTATFKGVTSAAYVVNNLTVNERQQFVVTLGDDGTELSTDNNGDVELPNRTATTAGRSFVGWSNENLSSATKTSPTIISVGKYRPTASVTLYPVYKYSVQEGSGDASYNITTTLTAGKTYIFGAVKAAASATLANNTTFGAVAFTNTYSDKSNNWGGRIDLIPDANGKISASNNSITAECKWELESIDNGNYKFKKGTNYLYLGDKTGSTTNGAQSGISSSGCCYLENVTTTCKDAFMLHNSSTSTNVMLYNTSNGYRMYASRNYSATMSPYFRFYEYTAGVVDVDYYTAEE